MTKQREKICPDCGGALRPSEWCGCDGEPLLVSPGGRTRQFHATPPRRRRTPRKEYRQKERAAQWCAR